MGITNSCKKVDLRVRIDRPFSDFCVLETHIPHYRWFQLTRTSSQTIEIDTVDSSKLPMVVFASDEMLPTVCAAGPVQIPSKSPPC